MSSPKLLTILTTAAILLSAPPPLAAQSGSASSDDGEPKSILEVSAVKLHPSNAPCGEVRVLAGGQVEIGCFTLETMVREGLNLLPNQLTGGENWVRHDLWDIVAKDNHPAGKPEEAVYREVLLAVAEERFHLKLRAQKHSAKGFALTLATAGKLGPGLTPASGKPHSFDVNPGPSLVAHAIA